MSAEVIFLNRARRHTPFWMAFPHAWVWRGPSGQPQGPGLYVNDNYGDPDPGLANLVWLAMDLDFPPGSSYNLRENNLATLLTINSKTILLGGLPLRDQAASLTINQFAAACKAEPTRPGVIPLLGMLAMKRLTHAHT